MTLAELTIFFFLGEERKKQQFMKSCLFNSTAQQTASSDSFLPLPLAVRSFPLLLFIVYAGLNNNKDVGVKAAGA